MLDVRQAHDILRVLPETLKPLDVVQKLAKAYQYMNFWLCIGLTLHNAERLNYVLLARHNIFAIHHKPLPIAPGTLFAGYGCQTIKRLRETGNLLRHDSSKLEAKRRHFSAWRKKMLGEPLKLG